MTNNILLLGVVLIIGLAVSKTIKQIKLPIVTGYMIIGIILGISFCNIISVNKQLDFQIINDIALGIIAFSIGLELNFFNLRKVGKSILVIAFFESFVAFVLVASFVYLFFHKLYLALILGAVSSATAPAATVMVLQEYKAKGILTSTILGIVALDDSFALIIYSFAASIAKVQLDAAATFSVFAAFVKPLIEISGSLLIGAVIGWLYIYFLKKIKAETELLIFVLGGIALCSGVCLVTHYSALLANMTFGAVITNFSKFNDKRITREIERFSPPIYLLFFIFAGARLNISAISKVGAISLVYFIMRIIGKVSGAYFGARISKAPEVISKYVGLGLLPQIGVAIALAIIVGRDFHQYGAIGTELSSVVINILLFTTIFTEIIGPYCTKYAITK